MKQISYVSPLFVFVLLVFFHSSTYARLLPPYQGEMKTDGIIHEGSSIKIKEDDLFNLMGLEECAEKDEDCLKRRVVAEAHLDYIYTQHHKPKGSP
ncbi:hypothetical protein F0562_016093 [Nyssa sinensis]|uniref:Phytosulfokine n=1 Tax=Nyssa sinensis TaxID=561372 RepID=A0A5J4ZKW0_9ASTE|nr:hypothetical protein F0562_016093 [Nyssa sinensis]